ncbi:hypothetical protein C8N36_103178 [Pelagimonas varians]|uniref:Uncharacterized protein n=1 Tax=Pelagimonas varians TaxID=696760 RepID=A0A238KH19_9RHOB|nr:hypothetical protein C8N36_103178 [Pelagimonas varians]SMX41356.1 hypothetical protein PEV8663_02252 [Pelagimonas varians]
MSHVFEEMEKNPVRIFACKNCSHRLRFGSNSCGACYAKATILNRRIIAFLLLIFLTIFPFLIFVTLTIFT